MKIIFLLIFNAFILSSTHGQDNELQPLERLSSQADLRLRLLNTVIETNRRLELSLEGLEREGLAPEEFDRRWGEELRRQTSEYIEQHLNIVQLDEQKKSTVRRVLNSVRWERLGQLYQKVWRFARQTARRSGVGLAISLAVANVLNYIIPYLLTMAGQPLIAAIIFAAPVNPPTIFLHQAVVSARQKMELRSILGSREAVQEYHRLNVEVRKSLALEKTSDYFLPLDLEQGEFIRAREGRLLDFIKRSLGIARDESFRLETLASYLKRENVTEPIVEQLIVDTHLSEKAKLAMALQHLSVSLDGETFAKLKHFFSETVGVKQLAPNEFRALSRWVDEVLKGRSTQDLFASIGRAPASVHPMHLLTTWEQILLPELARGEQLSYVQVRHLGTRFHGFKVRKELGISELEFSAVLQDFSRYLREGLDARRGQCFRTPREVIQGLL